MSDTPKTAIEDALTCDPSLFISCIPTPPFDRDRIAQDWKALVNEVKRLQGIEAERELNVANSRIEKLKAFVLPFANCPCCNENEMCVTGCTFGNDCPEEFDRMILAREALK